MMDMAILVPTRGRPDNAKRLKKQISQTSSGFSNIGIFFLVDDDDPTAEEYESLRSISTVVHVGPSKRLGPWLNDFGVKIAPFARTVAFIGDDVMPRTWGWDMKVREALKENRMVYTDDGLQGENLPTAIFMTSELIQKAGYMVYPNLTHLYIDNHWKAWGEALGSIAYLPDVLLEHMHPYAQKAGMDATYEAANHPDMYSSDGLVYNHFVNHELPDLVVRCG